MKYSRVLAILSILAAALWLLLRPTGRETFASEKAASSSDSRTASKETAIENPKRHSAATESKALDQHLSRHVAAQLKDFILPHFEGKEISLHEALELLNEAYVEACFRSQEKPLGLKFSVKDEPAHPISFSLHGRSFLSCLKHLAALSGLVVKRDELTFELSRSETADQPRDLIFPNAGVIKEELRALAGLKPEEGDENWEPLLRSAGLLRETATRLSVSGEFIKVSGTQAEAIRLGSGLELASEFPAQIQISAKLLSTTSPLNIPRAAINEAEFLALMHGLPQPPDIQLTSHPSKVMKEGGGATIQMIKTTAGDESNWTGTVATFQAERTGFKIRIQDHFEHRSDESENLGWRGENDSTVSSGGTHLQLMSARNGVYQYRLFTVTAMDASGQPLSNAQSGPVAD